MHRTDRAHRPDQKLVEAFAHCEALTRAHYENFPVGSVLIPRALRPHVCSIYAFARTADDFADEPGLPDQNGWPGSTSGNGV